MVKLRRPDNLDWWVFMILTLPLIYFFPTIPIMFVVFVMWFEYALIKIWTNPIINQKE